MKWQVLQMYKVLVVDDEPLMLEGWKTMVDWQACGYELCGTATDGEEALAVIRAMEPDLVVTDIRMPVLDGIGLIRMMKEELGLSTKTVIVSGYSEFSYAQQALRYRVDHYVLKPLVTEEIHELLMELTDSLDDRRREEESAGREQAAAAAAAIVGLLKNGGPAAVETAARQLGVKEQTRCCLLLAEAAPGSGGGGRTGAAEPSPGISARLQALVDAGILDGLRTCLFEESPGRAGLLIMDDLADEGHLELGLQEAAARLGCLTEGLALYCSGEASRLSAVPEQYRQVMELRSRLMFGQRAGVHLFRGRPPESQCRLEDMASCAGSLLEAMEAGDTEGIRSSVDGLIRLLVNAGAKEGLVQTAVRHIHGELLRKFTGLAGRTGEATAWLTQILVGNDSAHPDVWSGDELKKLCIQASRWLEGRKEPVPESRSVITEAVEYLKHHYREKIQLQELAKQFHLHPVYFGQQFRRETGVLFNEYVHRLRINEARRMLRRTEMKIWDIALTLGYHDTEYFTEKFKALTGELPSSYKTKCKGERCAEQKDDSS